MKIYKDIANLPPIEKPVITIGSFDGVHLGHQQIIQQINDLAASIEGQSVLVTFHPHPRIVLGQDDNLRLLNTLEEKATLLEKYGVDALVVVPFSKAFANQSPDEYIKDFLVAKLHPRIIAIGYNHKFGKNRKGNISYLRKFEKEHQFEVVEISKKEVDSIAVSSTKVRQAVSEGKVALAKSLLGHPFVLSGTVVKGRQIGSEIGFPTANIQVDNAYKLIPPEGIYAVEVQHQDQHYQGMLYIGNRPTIDNDLQQTIEVNIFDFNQDIYEEQIKVYFIQYLRGDVKFNNVTQLKEQLKKDKEAALQALHSTPTTDQ